MVGVALVLDVFWPLPALALFLVLLDWGWCGGKKCIWKKGLATVILAYKQRVRRWI